MLFEFTLSELWKMEYPLEHYCCPICGAKGHPDDFFTVTHTAWCSLGKAISLAELEGKREKGK